MIKEDDEITKVTIEVKRENIKSIVNRLRKYCFKNRDDCEFFILFTSPLEK